VLVDLYGSDAAERCRIESYLIKAAPHAAPLARVSGGLCLFEARPPHTGRYFAAPLGQTGQALTRPALRVREPASDDNAKSNNYIG
jgi:hypothetical protein